MFIRSSSGLASGNVLEEALLHGLCELVERHSWQLVRTNPAKLRPLAQDSIPTIAVAELLARMRRRGLKVNIYDMTCEIGVPAVFAQLVAPDFPVVWHGAGCHTSAEVAVSRALTEAVQGRLTYIAGARDDLVSLTKGARSDATYLGFSEAQPRTGFDALPDVSTGDVAEDLRAIVGRLSASGYAPFFLELTRPGVGIPVALTFVPGLREIRG